MIGTREVSGGNPELPTWLGLSQPQLAYFIIFLPTHYFSFLIIFSTHPPKRMLPFSLFSFRSHFPTPSLSLSLSCSPFLPLSHHLSHSGQRRPPSLTLSLTPATGEEGGFCSPSLRRRLSLSMPSDPRKYRAQHPPTGLFLI
jgi:hypothetical protein